ncbi:hypothetical protein N9064_00655 [bacterium]|nr:hypothetical protein [bacterium]
MPAPLGQFFTGGYMPSAPRKSGGIEELLLRAIIPEVVGRGFQGAGALVDGDDKTGFLQAALGGQTPQDKANADRDTQIFDLNKQIKEAQLLGLQNKNKPTTPTTIPERASKLPQELQDMLGAVMGGADFAADDAAALGLAREQASAVNAGRGPDVFETKKQQQELQAEDLKIQKLQQALLPEQQPTAEEALLTSTQLEADTLKAQQEIEQIKNPEQPNPPAISASSAMRLVQEPDQTRWKIAIDPETGNLILGDLETRTEIQLK